MKINPLFKRFIHKDVTESDEHDLSYASPYVESESDKECRRPTPNDRNYWFPNVPVEEKRNEGDVFDNFDEAYNMYLEYSQKARFSIRKSTTKRKNGNIIHKYALCSKAGKPRKHWVFSCLCLRFFMVFIDMDMTRFKAIHDTNWYKLYDFVENHSHPLVEENNLDNLKARRKLDFSEKVFIHRASLSNIGPTKARHLRVVFMGGQNKVRGKAIDWKNCRRSLNKYIGLRDAQMYRMIFVTFTRIDHNQKSITFGAGLLSDETFHSYTWLLTAFQQAHGKEPLMAVTDQDAALRNAIEFVFP
nr:hypothetical protein [Tanacetum cinerariifolium]